MLCFSSNDETLHFGMSFRSSSNNEGNFIKHWLSDALLFVKRRNFGFRYEPSPFVKQRRRFHKALVIRCFAFRQTTKPLLAAWAFAFRQTTKPYFTILHPRQSTPIPLRMITNPWKQFSCWSPSSAYLAAPQKNKTGSMNFIVVSIIHNKRVCSHCKNPIINF